MSERVGYPMEAVYVACRADGFHKIGVTYNAPKRCKTLSGMTPARLRPIGLVKEFDLGGAAPVIEKVAHKEMVAWESRKLKTWAAVEAKLPKGITTRHCWNMWGARNAEED